MTIGTPMRRAANTRQRVAAMLALAMTVPAMTVPAMTVAATAVPAAPGPRPEGAAVAAAPAPAWILARIARPVPSSTPFVELRGSKLLKAPLRISGEYRHPDAATLVREVRAPYAETTTIRAGEATIERPGKASRRVSLSRYPELAG